MINLQATQKLYECLPIDESGLLPVTPSTQGLYEAPELGINPLDNWCGHIVSLQRRKLIFFVHEPTRFPLLLIGVQKADFAELNYLFIDTLMNTLIKCDANEQQLAAAHSLLRPLRFDRQTNRSAQGTLNIMKRDFESMLYYDRVNVMDLSPSRAAAWLADRPCSAKGRGYIFPVREMLALLSKVSVASCDPGHISLQ